MAIKIPDVFKRATEQLYDCLADVYIIDDKGVDEEYDGFDDETPAIGYEKIIEGMPCRISTKSVGVIGSNPGVSPTVNYEIRLFCDFEKYHIPPGSRFIVTDANGHTKQYKNSGDPFTNYQTHQSITIEMGRFI